MRVWWWLGFFWGCAKPLAPAPPPQLLLFTGVCIFSDTGLRNPRTGEPGIAMANGAVRVPCPIIVYDPIQLAHLPEPAAIYVLFHEYAHIVLGHGAATMPTDPAAQRAFYREKEREADCLAIQFMAQRYPKMVEPLLGLLADSEGDSEHDAGTDRITLMRRCLAHP